MKTIIWKELRENLKWAVLALLCLALAECWILGLPNSSGRGESLTVCSPEFLLITSFGCSIVGAALGALQILPELRRDQWAALLHRPLTRREIFFGKVIAGLLLYFLATALPLLGCAVYAATPGHFPGPFVPGMVLPAASDLLLGMAVYFAALLVSLDRSPWYGRRAILSLSVPPLFALHLAAPWMFSIPLVASLIFMAAACGNMMSNGPVKDRPKIARWSFVFVTLVGAAIGVTLLFMLLSLLGSTRGASSFFPYHNVVVTKEGQVLVYSDAGDGSAMRLTDPGGKPITDERYLGNNFMNSVRYFTPIVWNLKKGGVRQDASLSENPRWLHHYVRTAGDGNFEGPESWYLLVEKNYFVGYDKISRRQIGICDREGFHPPDAVPKPFPSRLAGSQWNNFPPYLYWHGGQLDGMDFSERSMTPLFGAPNDTIYGAAGFGPESNKTRYVGMALEKGFQILDLHGTTLVSLPYVHDTSVWSGISMTGIPGGDRIFVQYDPRIFPAAKKPMAAAPPTLVDEIDLHGNVLHSYTVTNQRPFHPPGWMERVVGYSLPFAPVTLGTLLSQFLSPKEERSFSGPEFSLADLSILFGIGAALGVGAFLRARRVGISGASALRWAAFVFCFGLPGLVTFRLTADWPTRVACPKCSRKRPIATEECPECHQAWPVPESNGTEIFQPAVP